MATCNKIARLVPGAPGELLVSAFTLELALHCSGATATSPVTCRDSPEDVLIMVSALTDSGAPQDIAYDDPLAWARPGANQVHDLPAGSDFGHAFAQQTSIPAVPSPQPVAPVRGAGASFASLHGKHFDSEDEALEGLKAARQGRFRT
jgi:hypothetical protein